MMLWEEADVLAAMNTDAYREAVAKAERRKYGKEVIRVKINRGVL